jgi:hypothetical protein
MIDCLHKVALIVGGLFACLFRAGTEFLPKNKTRSAFLSEAGSTLAVNMRQS